MEHRRLVVVAGAPLDRRAEKTVGAGAAFRHVVVTGLSACISLFCELL